MKIIKFRHKIDRFIDWCQEFKLTNVFWQRSKTLLDVSMFLRGCGKGNYDHFRIQKSAQYNIYTISDVKPERSSVILENN